MRKRITLKALGLIALLICGASTAQAQSVSISPSSTGSTPYYCMDVNNTGTPFSVTGNSLSNGTTTGNIVSYTWSTSGGIEITAGTGTSTVTIKPKSGTDYSPGQFSKYAKGKLKVICRVQHSYPYTVTYIDPCGNEDPKTETKTYTYYTNYTTEIEIRKSFDRPDGINDNEIVGPKCVKTGDRVTYSVAPWISLHELNKVGFDDYYWTIPAGVAQGDILYFSADKSSVTFDVGNDFDGKTMEVRMGSCNPTQAPMTLTLKAAPGQPTLPTGIDFSTGWCIPLDGQTKSIKITNTDPAATYTWGNLGGWLTDPSATTFVLNSGNNYTLNITPQDDARVLWLKVKNDCGTEDTYNLSVNRELTSNNQMQTALGSTCVEPGVYVPFEITGIDNTVAVTWTIVDGTSNGWKIYPGSENSAQPFILTGTGNATITATTACGNTITETFSVKPKVPLINSASPVCITPENPKIFKVKQIDPTVTYVWDYPSNWTEDPTYTVSGSIKLTPDATGGSIRVKAVASNGCTSDWSEPVDVSAPFSLEMKTPCVDAGLPGSIEVQIVGYDSKLNYTISIDDPAFGTITSEPDASGVFTIATTGEEGTFTVTVSGSNACDDMTSVDLQYTVEKEKFDIWEFSNPPFAFMVSFAVAPTDMDMSWYNNRSFEWSINGVAPYATNPGTPYYTTGVNMNMLPLQDSIIYVTVTNDITGCKTRKYRIVSEGAPIFRARSVSGFTDISDTQNTGGELTLYPNPTNAELTIDMSSEGNINFFIISTSGSIVKKGVNQQAKTTIDVSDLSSGTYVVAVQQGANKYTKQFIKK